MFQDCVWGAWRSASTRNTHSGGKGSIQDTLLIAGDATASKKTLVFNIVICVFLENDFLILFTVRVVAISL